MIVTVVTASLLPSLAIVYEERLAIQQEQTALHLLDMVISNWVHSDHLPISQKEIKQTAYTISFSINESEQLKACIHWIGKNGREYERCEYGKK